MSGNVFPLPFTSHLIFVAVAFLFFMIQFVRMRKKYQIILAIAVALTMLIYMKDTKMWFYGLGIMEFGLLIIAFVTSLLDKNVEKNEVPAEGAVEETEEAVQAAESEE